MVHYFNISPSLRFRATLYQCPETQDERQNMSAAVANRILDLNSVLRTTEDHSLTQLEEIAQEIGAWQQKVTMHADSLCACIHMYSVCIHHALVHLWDVCLFSPLFDLFIIVARLPKSRQSTTQ